MRTTEINVREELLPGAIAGYLALLDFLAKKCKTPLPGTDSHLLTTLSVPRPRAA